MSTVEKLTTIYTSDIQRVPFSPMLNRVLTLEKNHTFGFLDAVTHQMAVKEPENGPFAKNRITPEQLEQGPPLSGLGVVVGQETTYITSRTVELGDLGQDTIDDKDLRSEAEFQDGYDAKYEGHPMSSETNTTMYVFQDFKMSTEFLTEFGRYPAGAGNMTSSSYANDPNYTNFIMQRNLQLARMKQKIQYRMLRGAPQTIADPIRVDATAKTSTRGLDSCIKNLNGTLVDCAGTDLSLKQFYTLHDTMYAKKGFRPAQKLYLMTINTFRKVTDMIAKDDKIALQSRVEQMNTLLGHDIRRVATTFMGELDILICNGDGLITDKEIFVIDLPHIGMVARRLETPEIDPQTLLPIANGGNIDSLIRVDYLGKTGAAQPIRFSTSVGFDQYNSEYHGKIENFA